MITLSTLCFGNRWRQPPLNFTFEFSMCTFIWTWPSFVTRGVTWRMTPVVRVCTVTVATVPAEFAPAPGSWVRIGTCYPR